MPPWDRRFVPASLARVFVTIVAVATASLATCLGSAVAQEPTDPGREALARGQRAASEALVTYERHTPDRPLWAEALSAGREAARLAPDEPAPQRFLAHAYGRVGWYARAWDAWQAYVDLGGDFDASVERDLLEVARWMGYSVHDEGRYADAQPYLDTVLRLEPGDVGANTRLARYHLDRANVVDALPYVQALDGRVPELQSELLRVQRIQQYGDEGVAAFEAGEAALAGGAIERAVDHFETATEAAPTFAEAWLQLAVAMERSGRMEAAADAYRTVLEIRQVDARASEGLSRTGTALAELAAQRAAAEAAEAEAEAEAAAGEAAAAEAQAAAEEAAQAEAEAEAQAQEDEARAAEEAEAAQQALEEQEAIAEAAEAADADADAQLAEQARAEAGAAAEADAGARENAASANERQESQAGTGEPLLVVDATVTHVAEASGPSAGVAFIDVPALESDLSDRTSHVIHLRLEVRDGPTDVAARYQLCLVPTDITVRPACSPIGLLPVDGLGVYRATLPWSSLSGSDAIDWRRGVDSAMLILRREDGSPIAGDARDDEGSGIDAYLPMSVRLQAMAVPAGTPFPGWP